MKNFQFFTDFQIELGFLIMSGALSILIVYFIDFYKKDWNKSSKPKKWFYIFLPITAIIGILKSLLLLIQNG